MKKLTLLLFTFLLMASTAWGDALGVTDSTETERNNSVFRVDTLAELKSIQTSGITPTSPVYVAGRTSDGDGFEGYFYWDGSSTTTETTEGVYVAPTDDDGTGRWVRSYVTRHVDAAWFGLDLTGSTNEWSTVEYLFENYEVKWPAGTIAFTFPEPTTGDANAAPVADEIIDPSGEHVGAGMGSTVFNISNMGRWNFVPQTAGAVLSHITVARVSGWGTFFRPMVNFKTSYVEVDGGVTHATAPMAVRGYKPHPSTGAADDLATYDGTSELDGLTIEHGEIHHVDFGYYRDNAGEGAVNDVTIAHTYFHDNYAQDISLNSPAATVDTYTIYKNKFRDNHGLLAGTNGAAISFTGGVKGTISYNDIVANHEGIHGEENSTDLDISHNKIVTIQYGMALLHNEVGATLLRPTRVGFTSNTVIAANTTYTITFDGAHGLVTDDPVSSDGGWEGTAESTEISSTQIRIKVEYGDPVPEVGDEVDLSASFTNDGDELAITAVSQASVSSLARFEGVHVYRYPVTGGEGDPGIDEWVFSDNVISGFRVGTDLSDFSTVKFTDNLLVDNYRAIEVEFPSTDIYNNTIKNSTEGLAAAQPGLFGFTRFEDVTTPVVTADTGEDIGIVGYAVDVIDYTIADGGVGTPAYTTINIMDSGENFSGTMTLSFVLQDDGTLGATNSNRSFIRWDIDYDETAGTFDYTEKLREVSSNYSFTTSVLEISNGKLRTNIKTNGDTTGGTGNLHVVFDGIHIFNDATTDTQSASEATTSISDDSVTNAKLANMAAYTIKGNSTGSTGNPSDMTAGTVRGMLSLGAANTATFASQILTSGSPAEPAQLHIQDTGSNSTGGVRVEGYSPHLEFEDLSGDTPNDWQLWVDGKRLSLFYGELGATAAKFTDEAMALTQTAIIFDKDFLLSDTETTPNTAKFSEVIAAANGGVNTTVEHSASASISPECGQYIYADNSANAVTIYLPELGDGVCQQPVYLTVTTATSTNAVTVSQNATGTNDEIHWGTLAGAASRTISATNPGYDSYLVVAFPDQTNERWYLVELRDL